ncbi:response regulator [Pelagicoccus sp. SDUM812003]|uniref:response regulator n=1 Tax=Pelagicoccus sp. SDUM812003 TaxID=3041267 RepID=UPI00280D9C9C|nr:response regulator [Pelagicoccus sp. SDUM812003]MDQ8202102.1 response regulator [Pelagicoccus sp. SDUM812003]
MNKQRSLRPILLIEDNYDDYEATERSFRQAKLMNPIHWCKNAREGLDFLQQRKDGPPEELPCMILLDLNMPGMDGRSALKEIKKDPKVCSIPVIVLTTSSSELDVDFCYHEGASTYIQKPVEFDNLVKAAVRLRDYWFGVALLPN